MPSSSFGMEERPHLLQCFSLLHTVLLNVPEKYMQKFQELNSTLIAHTLEAGDIFLCLHSPRAPRVPG